MPTYIEAAPQTHTHTHTHTHIHNQIHTHTHTPEAISSSRLVKRELLIASRGLAVLLLLVVQPRCQTVFMGPSLWCSPTTLHPHHPPPQTFFGSGILLYTLATSSMAGNSDSYTLCMHYLLRPPLIQSRTTLTSVWNGGTHEHKYGVIFKCLFWVRFMTQYNIFKLSRDLIKVSALLDKESLCIHYLNISWKSWIPSMMNCM